MQAPPVTALCLLFRCLALANDIFELLGHHAAIA
jgi:hypothetical protein